MQVHFLRLSDEELWEQFRQGKQEAFSSLYERHVQALFHFGLRLNVNHQIVEDAIQELFEDFWKNRKQLSKVAQVKVYLLKSLRYKILREISNGRKRRTYSLEELLHELPVQELDRLDTNKERREKLKARLAFLSTRQREAIHLRYFQGLGTTEVAEIMNVNRQSVANLLHRAISSLKKKSKVSKQSKRPTS